MERHGNMAIIITMYTEKGETKNDVLTSHSPHLGYKNLLTVRKIQAQCKTIRYSRYGMFLFFILSSLYLIVLMPLKSFTVNYMFFAKSKRC